MQEGGNGKVFISSGFEHQAGDTKQMRNVRDGCALAVLECVFAGGKQECPFKTRTKRDDRLAFAFHRGDYLLHVVNEDNVAVDFAARQE